MRWCGRLRHCPHPLFYDQGEALNENWTDEPDGGHALAVIFGHAAALAQSLTGKVS
jgi:hypothetical protein